MTDKDPRDALLDRILELITEQKKTQVVELEPLRLYLFTSGGRVCWFDANSEYTHSISFISGKFVLEEL